uniref:Variant surface glycoprotein 1278 n=1 Tax=Trypanosoma brucei TaxID=5691 RepID=M4SZT7_9TRYP|nr:variant surface glycoprotein 1278 [Trypanosoma brucei]
MNAPKPTPIILYTVWLLGAPTASAVKQSAAREQCGCPCKCLARIAQLADRLRAAAEAAPKNLQKDAATIEKLLLGIADGNKELKRALTPLLATAVTKAAQYARTVETRLPKVKDHLQRLKEVAVLYDQLNYVAAAYDVAVITQAAVSALVSATFAANNHNKKTRSSCGNTEDDDKTPIEDLVFTFDQGIEVTELTMETTLKCTNQGGSGACNNVASDKVTIGAHFKHTTSTHAGGQITGKIHQKIGITNIKLSHLTTSELQAKHSAAFQAAAALLSHRDLTALETYTASSDFNTLVYRAVIEDKPVTEITGSKKTAVEAALRKYYGKEDGTEFQTKIWQAIEKTKATYYSGKDDQTVDISQLNGDTQAAAAVASGFSKFQRTQNYPQGQGKSSETQIKSSTEKCKENTEATKCTEDKDCEHKDGKCELKDTIKVKGEGRKKH